MTDTGYGVEVDDRELVNLLAVLMGGRELETPDDPHFRSAMFGGPGVLRRLLQSFQGDPCGGQYALAIPAAATRLAVPDEANSATVTVEVSPVRVTFDSIAPTAANGLLIATGGPYVLTGRATLQGAQFFQGGAGAVLQVAYFT